MLLRGFHSVVGQSEPRLIAVASVFVQHALGDGAIDGGHRGIEQIPGGSCIARGDGRAQALDQCADPGAVGAVHFGPLTRWRRALQN